jgi:hypothetical protein
MRNKRLVGLGAGLALATAVTVPALTGSAAAGSGQSFTVYAQSSSDTNIDNGKPGFSAGDYDVHTDPLTRGGKTVGWNDGSCLTTSVSAKTADQLCEFVLHLPNGQIVADGAVRSGQNGPGTFVLAITGGTGRYSSAGGELTVTASNGPVRLDVSIN